MYSRVTYTANGEIAEFTIPFPYLRVDTLQVRVNQVLLTRGTDYTVNGAASTLTLTHAPYAGALVNIRRVTPRLASERVVIFTDPSDIRADVLNAADLQLLYIIQEALDDIAEGVGVGTVIDPGAALPANVENAINSQALVQANALSAEVAARIAAILAEANARADALLAEQTARAAAVAAEASARASALAAEALARGTAITNERTLREAADESLAAEIEVLSAANAANAAAIINEQSARATAIEAEATTRQAAIAVVQGNVAAAMAAVEAEASARASADAAEATSRHAAIASLQSQVDEKASLAAVLTEQTARVTAVEALAKDLANLVAVINDNSAAINVERIVRTTAIEAEATTREAHLASLELALDGEVTARTAAVATETTARINADNALSSILTVLESAVNHADTGLAATRARLLTEESARASADSAQSHRIGLLEASVDTPTTGLTARVLAAELAVTETEGVLASLAARVTTVETAVDTNADGIANLSTLVSAEQLARTSAVEALAADIARIIALANDNAAAITIEQAARADAVSAEVATRTSAVASLQTQVDGKATTAALIDEQQARVTQLDALARDIARVMAVFNDNAAAIVTEQSARTTAYSALASSVTTLTASLGGVSSTVEELAEAYLDGSGAATAQWGFKLNAGGKVVGMKAIARSGGAAPETAEIVFAGADMRSDNYTEGGDAGWFLGYGGNLIANSGLFRGTVRLGAATGFMSGNGVWMGLDDGVAKFRVGKPDGNRIVWDGNTWTVVGFPLTSESPAAPLSTPGTNTIRVSAPTSPPPGYAVFWRKVGSGGMEGPLTLFPFDITMTNGTEQLLIWSSAPGYSLSTIVQTSYNELTL